MCRDTLTWSANPPISRHSSVSRLVSVASRSPRPRACNGAWCPAPIQMFLRRGSALVPWTRIRLARPGLLHLTVQTHPMHPISASTVDYLHVLRAKHTPSLCPSDDIRRSDHRPLRRTNSCISDRQTTRAAMQRRDTNRRIRFGVSEAPPPTWQPPRSMFRPSEDRPNHSRREFNATKCTGILAKMAS